MNSNAMGVQIDVQPAALIATVPADIALEDLNRHLHAYALYLPIIPFEQGLTLADIVAQHHGGRYQLRYGTIARYLRAATVQMEMHDATRRVLTFGGHTIKRATGYRLPQSLVGRTKGMSNGFGIGTSNDADTVPWEAAYGSWELVDLTVSLRPLPLVRRAMLFGCPDLLSACQFATSLAHMNLSLSSLAVTSHQPLQQSLGTGPLLLAVLEGMPDVVARQLDVVQALARDAQAVVLDICDDMPQDPCRHWHMWEYLARHWQGQASADVAMRGTLSLPHAAMLRFMIRAHDITRSYHVHLHAWGDVGVGTLHTWLEAVPGIPITHGEILQAARLIYHMPRQGHTSTMVSQSQFSLPVALSASNVLAQVRAIVGEPYVLTQPEELGAYATDASIAQATGAPLAVVLPATTHEVAEVMRAAAAAHVPVVTRGAASGLAGGSTASEGALMLSLTRMRVLHVFQDQMMAHAEAGVITIDIQQAAERYGLFYPPDPSSQTISTIGGNIACNAGGPRCVKYGVTADYVQSLTAVLPDGRVVHVGNGCIAMQCSDAALMHLLIGSEGTLAVITEATLRLVHRPLHRRTAMALFERLEDACAAVEDIIAAGVVPAALELMDSTTIAVVEDYLCMGLPRDAGALLIMMADGELEAVDYESETMAAIARRFYARSVRVAHSADDEALLWRGRRSIGPALARVRPNRLPEDISVPVYEVAETVRRIKAIAERYGMPIPVFGHAGDGNLHPNVLFDARDEAQTVCAWQAAEEVFGVALDVGGTLSGEHGIGMLKRACMPIALGGDVLALQRAIKATFDPHNRMNPGKVLP